MVFLRQNENAGSIPVKNHILLNKTFNATQLGNISLLEKKKRTAIKHDCQLKHMYSQIEKIMH